MSALDNAMKISRAEVLERINALSIQEYGLCRGPLIKRLQAAACKCREEGQSPGVVCALNNADTDGVLLALLKERPQLVMEGIVIAAYALEAERKVLYIPDYVPELAEALQEVAAQYQVELKTGIVDVRACQWDALIHIVTAANLAGAFAGQPGRYDRYVYVSVMSGPLQQVTCDTKISELADCKDAKAILLGYQYYPPEAADLTVGEAQIENGVITVMTAKDCIVAETEKKLMACREQSCGKCVFCREGLIQLQHMQKEIAGGKGNLNFLEITKEIGSAMTYSTPCTLGQTAPAIALSAISHLEFEYEAHIKKKACPAGICFSSERIYIDPKLCSGCGECIDVCPEDCIQGKSNFIHMIDDYDCTQCGKCIDACQEAAVIKTSGKVPKLPNRLTKAGRFKQR